MKETQQNEVHKFPKTEGTVGIIIGEFHKDIGDNLLASCLEQLSKYKIELEKDDVYWVPGAFEIPWMAKILASKKRYDVLIALGVIIKGDTHHYEIVSSECARGIMQVMLDSHVPVIYEVLSCLKKEDALKRCGNNDNNNNKGIAAAEAAVKMLKYSHNTTRDEILPD